MARLVFPALRDDAALDMLNKRTTDWTIHNRDWPRHGARYEVHAVNFFAVGKGAGRTLGEAVQRALLQMERRDALMPRASLESLKDLLENT